MARISGQLQRKKAACCGGTADPPASRDRLTNVFTATRALGLQTAMQRGRFLRALWCAVSLLSSFANAFAEDAGEATRSSATVIQKAVGARETDAREAMCLMIESAARESNLPLEFFARVIWQESRFQPDAIGPVTRSGERAQGIAQFMPGTAGERGLLDPFDPVQALPKSAEFLRELRDQFGNLGLAAAAYNAGPARVRGWLAGSRSLPLETRRYVQAITGISADEWAKGGNREPEKTIPNCRQMMALLKRAPNPFVDKLQERVKLTAESTWGIQLSAGFSREQVLAAYARI